MKNTNNTKNTLTKFNLPHYTCERYYLISEIEVRSKFIFLDHENPEIINEHGINAVSIYLIWNQKEGTQKLFEQISKIIDIIPNSIKFEYSIISVEVYSIEFEADISNQLQEINDFITEKLPTSTVIWFGVSNSRSGTCGMELIYEFCKNTVDKVDTIYTIAAHEGDMLGLDCGDQSLHAESDVIQSIYSSQNLSIVEWCNTFNLVSKKKINSEHRWLV